MAATSGSRIIDFSVEPQPSTRHSLNQTVEELLKATLHKHLIWSELRHGLVNQAASTDVHVITKIWVFRPAHTYRYRKFSGSVWVRSSTVESKVTTFKAAVADENWVFIEWDKLRDTPVEQVSDLSHDIEGETPAKYTCHIAVWDENDSISIKEQAEWCQARGAVALCALSINDDDCFGVELDHGDAVLLLHALRRDHVAHRHRRPVRALPQHVLQALQHGPNVA